jgi:undecaprenyl-diphosphatase
VIQTGTLVAVCLALRTDITALLRGTLAAALAGRPLSTPEARLGWLIILGTIPIVAAGLAFKDLIRGEARRLDVVVAALVAATALMAVAELACLARARRRGTAGRDGLERVTATDGIAMGLAQAFALIPGTSRSGVTISAGMLAGLDRQTAARFSFLLSLPAVAAAALLEAWQQRSEILGSGPQAVALAVGTITAGIVGYAAVRWLLSMLTGHTLWPFIVYRLGLAALLAGSLAAGWLTSPAI